MPPSRCGTSTSRTAGGDVGHRRLPVMRLSQSFFLAPKEGVRTLNVISSSGNFGFLPA